MLMLLFALTSLAGGHYHPPDIAGKSKVYTKAADKAGQQFRDRSADVQVTAKALVDYREALDLLGDRAPAAELERLQSMQKQFNRDRAVLEAFANTMMDDFDQEFSTALTRALPANASACQGQFPTGPALPGIPSPTEANPDCTGDDLNATLAATLDKDPVLKTAVDEILALQWPAVRPEPTPQSPVGPTERWVATQPWFRSVAGSSLKKIDNADEAGRLDFHAALEDDASPQEMKELLGAARALTEKTASRRAALAVAPLAAVDTWNLKKAKKNLDVGWCANPEAFGGCTGTDASKSVGTLLRADKRVLKAFR